MDLGTIRRRLLTERYARGGREALLADMRRTFSNAQAYHAAGSAAHAAAIELDAFLDAQLEHAYWDSACDPADDIVPDLCLRWSE